MLPIRHKSIFKSRWIALLWAGGVLWGAIEFTGSQTAHKTTGDNDDVAAAQAVANALEASR
jgi:hypothetical protein